MLANPNLSDQQAFGQDAINGDYTSLPCEAFSMASRTNSNAITNADEFSHKNPMYQSAHVQVTSKPIVNNEEPYSNADNSEEGKNKRNEKYECTATLIPPTNHRFSFNVQFWLNVCRYNFNDFLSFRWHFQSIHVCFCSILLDFGWSLWFRSFSLGVCPLLGSILLFGSSSSTTTTGTKNLLKWKGVMFGIDEPDNAMANVNAQTPLSNDTTLTTSSEPDSSCATMIEINQIATDNAKDINAVDDKDQEVCNITLRRECSLSLFFNKFKEKSCTFQIITVELSRGWNSRLGFSLRTESNSKHTVISAIYSESVAAKDGRLRVGDRIVMVSGFHQWVCSYRMSRNYGYKMRNFFLSLFVCPNSR